MDKRIAVTWTMNTPKGSFDFGYPPEGVPPIEGERPIWMKNFKSSWDSPSEPVHYEFDLEDESYVQDALNYLYNGPVNGVKYPAQEQ